MNMISFKMVWVILKDWRTRSIFTVNMINL